MKKGATLYSIVYIQNIYTCHKATMDVVTLASVLQIKDYLRLFCDSKPELMLIATDFKKIGREAYKVYNNFQDYRKNKKQTD